ncbi:MAG: hypothetical protein HFG26_08810 [Provencibacterium sp.]|jgi:hypothetical protein|nr:hypothetical protein [Provencibacterium sp.]
MKISELTTDESLDILCELTPIIFNITNDSALSEELRRKIDPENLKTQAGIVIEGTKKLNVLIPIVLKSHRADIYQILSLLNRKTSDEIARQNFIQTGMQIRELIKDKELIDFFTSFVQSEETVS